MKLIFNWVYENNKTDCKITVKEKSIGATEPMYKTILLNSFIC